MRASRMRATNLAPQRGLMGARLPSPGASIPIAPLLRIGARTDAGQIGDLIQVTSDEPMADIHPEIVSVSAGGERIALLAHAWGGEHTDEFTLRTSASEELAAKVRSSIDL
jgi:hypothetical protein